MSKNDNQSREQDAQNYDVFLSYSRRDTQTAMLIKSAIQSLGYTVFYDQDILEGDSNWRASIAKNIDNCNGLVFFRTQNSVASKWCQREVNIADESDKTILPVSFQHDQKSLPSSPELKCALLSLQTTYISESPTIADLKNELQPALEKSIGKPQGKENSLLLTDMMATAADNLNSRYKDLFESIQARRIESDVLNDRISFYWPFVLGDEQAKLCISLNKFSRRPVCYANCKRKKSCPFFVEKDRQVYFLEAYLDFSDHGKLSRIEPLLESLFLRINAFPFWCGNWGTKYFIRRRILEELKDGDINEKNDFTAVLDLLREAVRFFDSCFNGRMRQYFQFAYQIVSIFREKERTASLLGEGWTLHDEQKSRVKLHFSKNDSVHPDKSELGYLCSCAIDFPEAVRIKLEGFDPDAIRIRISRFDQNLKTAKIVRYDPKTDTEPWQKLKTGIDGILTVEKEKLDNVSRLPDYLHDSLNKFITRDTPKSLCWEVAQDRYGYRLTVECWFPGCREIRFGIVLLYHPEMKILDWNQTITSSFPGTTEDEADRLSGITGYHIIQRNIENPDKEGCRQLFNEVALSLNRVYDRIYNEISQPLSELELVTRRWKLRRLPTVLLSDSRSGNWSDNGRIGNDEKCWAYYLAPGMRFCQRLRRKEYPVMFCIRFEQSGAKKATVGWAADGDFNALSVREKDLFWHCVLSLFPPELRDRFTCKKNAVFLAKAEDRTLDSREKRPEVFGTVQDVRLLLEDWLKNDEPKGGCLMDQMFATIEKAVENFRIQTISQ